MNKNIAPAATACLNVSPATLLNANAMALHLLLSKELISNSDMLIACAEIAYRICNRK